MLAGLEPGRNKIERPAQTNGRTNSIAPKARHFRDVVCARMTSLHDCRCQTNVTLGSRGAGAVSCGCLQNVLMVMTGSTREIREPVAEAIVYYDSKKDGTSVRYPIASDESNCVTQVYRHPQGSLELRQETDGTRFASDIVARLRKYMHVIISRVDLSSR